MSMEIIEDPLVFHLYGLSSDVEDFDYAAAGIRLMEAVNGRVALAGLDGGGTLYWVYDSAVTIFVGNDYSDPDAAAKVLDHKAVALRRCLYHKYVGPYSGLPDVHREMEKIIKNMNEKEIGPRVEKYSEWNEDESKLVTEVFIGLE